MEVSDGCLGSFPVETVHLALFCLAFRLVGCVSE